MKTPPFPGARSLLILAAVALVAAPLFLQARTWTQASTGRTIEGDLVKTEGDTIHIRLAAGGKVVPVPIAMLSDDDKKFLDEQAKATTPGSDTPAGESGEPLKVGLHEMHLCCKSCEKGVQQAIAEIEGVKADIGRDEDNRDRKIVTLDCPNQAAARKAIDAIAAAGFWGESDSHDVDFKGAGAKGGKAKSVTVTGVHLCCKSCVEAVDKALMSVDGVEEHTAKNKAESFEVTGDFAPGDVLRNLRRAGFNGTVE